MKYTTNELKYFNLFVRVHKMIINRNNNDIRISFYKCKKINEILESIFTMKEQDFEKALYIILDKLSLIQMYQPFYDGNHRTCFYILAMFLQRYDQDISYKKILQAHINGVEVIPIRYKKEDIIYPTETKNIKKLIQK